MVSVLLVNGDALKIPLADGSVHCCVTSPPYWGLRDYGISDQLGLEPTPEQYVANMVAVFREVWRVLRDDGTLWLNIGDTYGTGTTAGRPIEGSRGFGDKTMTAQNSVPRAGGMAKQLMGVPWRVAFALQSDGWYLRSDCIWNKPNPMPESVTDRPTKSHEYLFLLTKSARYFYDADAIRESAGSPITKLQSHHDPNNPKYQGAPSDRWLDQFNGRVWDEIGSRNKRTVWEIATYPWSGAHFATFPPALVEPCIKAGTSERGVCPECGAPWERVVEKGKLITPRPNDTLGIKYDTADNGTRWDTSTLRKEAYYKRIQTGWRPTCNHDTEPVPATILDPFAGSGTTPMVARQLGRHGVGIDLSYPYLHDQARERLQLTALDEWTHGKKDGASVDDLPLFATQEPQT